MEPEADYQLLGAWRPPKWLWALALGGAALLAALCSPGAQPVALAAVPGPEPRKGMFAGAALLPSAGGSFEKELVVWGGADGSTGSQLGHAVKDLWAFCDSRFCSPSVEVGHKANIDGHHTEVGWRQLHPQVAGTPPVPRFNGCTFSDHSTRMFVFGGTVGKLGDQDFVMNDLDELTGPVVQWAHVFGTDVGTQALGAGLAVSLQDLGVDPAAVPEDALGSAGRVLGRDAVALALQGRKSPLNLAKAYAAEQRYAAAGSAEQLAFAVARHAPGCAFWRGGAYIFGGKGFGGDVSNAMWRIGVDGGDRGEVTVVDAAEDDGALRPTARKGHCMDLAADNRGTRLISHGGRDGSHYSAELWAYGLEPATGWTLLFDGKRVGQAPRNHHACAILRSQFFIFGGRTGRKLDDVSNELWGWDLEASFWRHYVAKDARGVPLVPRAAPGPLEDEWETDGGVEVWPEARFLPGMAPDPASGGLLVTMGQGFRRAASKKLERKLRFNDVWRWVPSEPNRMELLFKGHVRKTKP